MEVCIKIKLVVFLQIDCWISPRRGASENVVKEQLRASLKGLRYDAGYSYPNIRVFLVYS